MNEAAPAPAATQPEQPPQPPPPDALTTAFQAATNGLKLALRSMVAARVPEADADRLRCERAFEAARNTSPATRAALETAAAALQGAASFLANTSTTRPDDLRAVRTAASGAAKYLAATSEAPPSA